MRASRTFDALDLQALFFWSIVSKCEDHLSQKYQDSRRLVESLLFGVAIKNLIIELRPCLRKVISSYIHEPNIQPVFDVLRKKDEPFRQGIRTWFDLFPYARHWPQTESYDLALLKLRQSNHALDHAMLGLAPYEVLTKKERIQVESNELQLIENRVDAPLQEADIALIKKHIWASRGVLTQSEASGVETKALLLWNRHPYTIRVAISDCTRKSAYLCTGGCSYIAALSRCVLASFILTGIAIPSIVVISYLLILYAKSPIVVYNRLSPEVQNSTELYYSGILSCERTSVSAATHFAEKQWGGSVGGFYHMPSIPNVLSNPFQDKDAYYVFDPEQTINIQFWAGRNAWCVQKSARYAIGAYAGMGGYEEVYASHSGKVVDKNQLPWPCYKPMIGKKTYDTNSLTGIMTEVYPAQCNDLIYWQDHFCAKEISEHGLSMQEGSKGSKEYSCYALAEYYKVCSLGKLKELIGAFPNGPADYPLVLALLGISSAVIGGAIIVLVVCACILKDQKVSVRDLLKTFRIPLGPGDKILQRLLANKKKLGKVKQMIRSLERTRRSLPQLQTADVESKQPSPQRVPSLYKLFPEEGRRGESKQDEGRYLLGADALSIAPSYSSTIN